MSSSDPQQPEALTALMALVDEREARIEALTNVLERKNEEEAQIRSSYQLMYSELTTLRELVATKLGVQLSPIAAAAPAPTTDAPSAAPAAEEPAGASSLEPAAGESPAEPLVEPSPTASSSTQPAAEESPPHLRLARQLSDTLAKSQVGIARGWADVDAWRKEALAKLRLPGTQDRLQDGSGRRDSAQSKRLAAAEAFACAPKGAN